MNLIHLSEIIYNNINCTWNTVFNQLYLKLNLSFYPWLFFFDYQHDDIIHRCIRENSTPCNIHRGSIITSTSVFEQFCSSAKYLTFSNKTFNRRTTTSQSRNINFNFYINIIRRIHLWILGFSNNFLFCFLGSPGQLVYRLSHRIVATDAATHMVGGPFFYYIAASAVGRQRLHFVPDS